MRVIIRRLLCTLSSIACIGNPAAATVNPLASTSPWDLDYGVTQCTAMRAYGSSDRPVTLAVVPAPNGENYELVVTYKGRTPLFAEEVEGTLNFGSRPVRAWGLRYGRGNLTLYRFRISATDMVQARSARFVSFSVKGDRDVSFKLENMPELMDGLQKCTVDLEEYWNVNGEKSGRVAVPPKGDLRTIFRAGDYPGEALRRMQGGTAQYMLLIDEKGAVAGCHVLKASGVAALDVMGCLVIKERSKIIPAKDATGKPVRSTFVTPPVVWRIAH